MRDKENWMAAEVNAEFLRLGTFFVPAPAMECNRMLAKISALCHAVVVSLLQEMDDRDVAKINLRPFPFPRLNLAPLARFSHESHLATARQEPRFSTIKMRMLALATRTYDPVECELRATAPCWPIVSPQHVHHTDPVASLCINPLTQRLRRYCHAFLIAMFSIGLHIHDSLSQLGNVIYMFCKSFAMLVFALLAVYCAYDGEDCLRVF